MRKLDTWVDYLAVAAIAAVVVAILVFVTASCTPQSTMPFDPSRKQSSEELELQQIKSVMPAGMADPYSGMDCLDYVEYRIAYCEATYQCTIRQYRALKRDLVRLNKSYTSQCLYSKEHIQGVFRAMRPRGRNPMGN